MITKLAVRIAAAVLLCGIAGVAHAASLPIENTDWKLATLGDNPLTTWQSLAPVMFRLDASTKRIATRPATVLRHDALCSLGASASARKYAMCGSPGL